MKDPQATQPLGVADLTSYYSERPTLPGHWYWCRRHEQAHKVGEKCLPGCKCGSYPDAKLVHRNECPWHPNRDFMASCIDIGPFMSEREANRMRGERQTRPHEPTRTRPLGMEIEP